MTEHRMVDARMLEALNAENQRLQQVIAAQQQVLHQRAEPMATAVLDTIDRWCEMAEQPGNPAQVVARSLVERWVKVQERAQRVAAGIVVVRNLPPNGREPS